MHGVIADFLTLFLAIPCEVLPGSRYSSDFHLNSASSGHGDLRGTPVFLFLSKGEYA